MNYVPRYTRFLRKHVSVSRPLRLVFDCSNGTTGPVVRALFAKHPHITTHIINAKPDGNFPAHGPDPWKPGAMNDLKAAVTKHSADLGVIFDADGDRVFFVDDAGSKITEDAAAVLIASRISGPVLLNVSMGFLVREFLKKTKRPVIDSRTGHAFIKKTMRFQKIPFGAEKSGHYYFKRFFYADSGMFSAIQVLNAVARLKKPLSDHIASFPQYFQSGEKNFRVKERAKAIEKIHTRFKNSAKKITTIDGLRMEFKNARGHWWFGVRASNTENVLRLNVEADSRKLLQEKLKTLTTLIQKSK